MTVSNTTNRKTYAGNGVTTSFATSPVVFFDSDDLIVVVVNDDTGAEETLVLDSDYSVTGGAGTTGTVNLAGGSSPYGAPAADYTVVIQRTLSAVQEYDPENGDAMDAESLEDQFDKIVMILQQVLTRLDRTIEPSIGTTTSLDLTLPQDGGYLTITDGVLSANAGTGDYVAMTVRSVTDSTYTLVTADNNGIVRMVNGGAVTVPTGLDAGHITGIVSGSGTVDVVAGSGATVSVASGYDAELAETNSFAAVIMISTTTGVLTGDLTLA